MSNCFNACGKYPDECRAYPMVRMADATYVSALGANKLVRRNFVIFVATKPGNTDCTMMPCSLYSVERSSENLSTKALKNNTIKSELLEIDE